MHSRFPLPESAGELEPVRELPVLICGSTREAIDTAIFIRRLGDPVTLLADTLRRETRESLRRAGIEVVIASPFDAATLAAAGAARARTIFIALESDLRCIEVVLAARETWADVPIVCNVGDAELARRLERSFGVRTTVCATSIEAVHLAASALGTDVVGAFSLDEDIVLVKRRVAGFESHESILVIDDRDGRRLIAPGSGVPIEPRSVVTTIERITKPRPRARAFAFASSLMRGMRTMRANTPAGLGWAALMFVTLAILSVFVFKAGMSIPFGDAAYLVLNTISTVGYGDITPFESGQHMRLAGAFVALLGPALIGTLLLIAARVVLRPFRDAAPASGHILMVGAPGVVAAAAAHLRNLSFEPVVATEGAVDELMKEMNASTASAIVAATPNPVANVTMGLAARELNPSIHTAVAAPAKLAREMRMSTPAAVPAVQIAVAASASLAPGVRYAFVSGDHLFTFIEGTAGSGWSELAQNFLPLYRRTSGAWTPIGEESSFSGEERILVVAWRRLGRSSV